MQFRYETVQIAGSVSIKFIRIDPWRHHHTGIFPLMPVYQPVAPLAGRAIGLPDHAGHWHLPWQVEYHPLKGMV